MNGQHHADLAARLLIELRVRTTPQRPDDFHTTIDRIADAIWRAMRRRRRWRAALVLSVAGALLVGSMTISAGLQGRNKLDHRRLSGNLLDVLLVHLPGASLKNSATEAGP